MNLTLDRVLSHYCPFSVRSAEQMAKFTMLTVFSTHTNTAFDNENRYQSRERLVASQSEMNDTREASASDSGLIPVQYVL